VGRQAIAFGGGAPSRLLMYHDGLITMTDISCHTDFRIMGARLPSSPPFLSPSDEEEGMIHGGSVKTIEKRIWKKKISRRWQRSNLHEGFCLFIDEGGVKPIPIRVLAPWKVSSHHLWKSRSTSQDPRLIKSEGYQPSLPHDICHYGAMIQKDVGYRFHANLINWHANYHPAT